MYICIDPDKDSGIGENPTEAYKNYLACFDNCSSVEDLKFFKAEEIKVQMEIIEQKASK